MNFFKSILSDDPDPLRPDISHDPGPSPPIEDRNTNAVAPNGSSNANAWSFGGLIKTLSTKSESLIETYRKDLEEFGSGLKKETEIIREVASRAVKDLPSSLEAGTSAAHGVLDGVLKSTAEIISKETKSSESDGESVAPEANDSSKPGRYSWFETQLSLTQSDLNTFCEKPEDVEEFNEWKLGFQLGEQRDEIEGLIGENGNLEGVYGKLVPSVVDRETFFCRYFYRVDKLKQQEKVRVNLMKRAISVDDDDDVSWDVDDEGSNNDKSNVAELINKDCSQETKFGDVKSHEKVEKPEESVEKFESGEKSDVFVRSDDQEKMEDEEEDLGWDEIEDTGSDDEKEMSTTTHGERPIRANLIQKLNVEEDDEDLSWDVEDDDDKPVKP